jgi:hypothetical protein
VMLEDTDSRHLQAVTNIVLSGSLAAYLKSIIVFDERAVNGMHQSLFSLARTGQGYWTKVR